MPLTNRRRIMFLSPEHEERLGEQAYREILSSSRLLPPSHPMSRAVTRVGRKIAQETNAPFMKWTFHVIEAKEPNAFCLPGGKVFVHSGLFKVLRNEDALAAVMFHEAAHGLARHGAEKISFSLLVYGLLALIFPDYGQISDLVTTVLSVKCKVLKVLIVFVAQMVKLAVDLPFSRKLELEADSIGLRLMAQACYDPRASIQMNTSLGQLDKGSQFKYFSTHPPSAERVQALREQLNNALEIYEASDCGSRKQAFAKAMKPAFSPQGNASFDW
ncbi:Mitochondrial metalloendopeptidase OMA1 [Phytophthora nicotianae]|uniref:Mitochondrial metalloendopeptidase OMA1 n=1 Tax=Phytophthora nicotianae TaxID=4792 RepID=A0A0W8DJP7_PHYNI|nr:Mitochondrial metalloendopeptidase OMA1 [Phytophthora nicotianae]